MRINKTKCDKCLKMKKDFNNSMVLRKLKEFYNFNNYSELAVFLGIMPGTLSGWQKRGIGNWDLIFDKCTDIDFNWLIKGVYMKSDTPGDSCLNCENKDKMIDRLEKENERLLKYIDIIEREKKIANCSK